MASARFVTAIQNSAVSILVFVYPTVVLTLLDGFATRFLFKQFTKWAGHILSQKCDLCSFLRDFDMSSGGTNGTNSIGA